MGRAMRGPGVAFGGKLTADRDQKTIVPLFSYYLASPDLWGFWGGAPPQGRYPCGDGRYADVCVAGSHRSLDRRPPGPALWIKPLPAIFPSPHRLTSSDELAAVLGDVMVKRVWSGWRRAGVSWIVPGPRGRGAPGNYSRAGIEPSPRINSWENGATTISQLRP